jgi:hypothetical protein
MLALTQFAQTPEKLGGPGAVAFPAGLGERAAIQLFGLGQLLPIDQVCACLV